jgi:hypothetical protein
MGLAPKFYKLQTAHSVGYVEYGCPLVYPNARLLGKKDVILDVALDITHVVIFLLWMSL